MSEQPLVSVVTCSYNNAKYILETLESIRNQTYPNIELIIIDDCSTDESVFIIEHWLKTYSGKYKFIKHEINKGGSIPYNIGIENATGKYYCTVDSDDAILPEKIEKQVSILESSDPEVAAVYSDAYVMDVSSNITDGLFIQRHRQFSKVPSGNIYHQLLAGNYIPIMTLMIKRDVFRELGGYDESLSYGDYDMWLRITRKYEFLHSDYISGKYRIRPGSLCFTIKNWDYSDAKIFLKHVGAPLPIERLNSIAYRFYDKGDEQGMVLVSELARKTGDLRLITAWLLWKFQIARHHARQIIDVVNGHASRTLPQQIISSKNAEINIFLKDIVSLMPRNFLKSLVCDAFYRHDLKLLSLVRALARSTKSRYYKAVLLLWKYKVNISTGMVILDRIDGYCRAERKNLYIDLCIYKDIFDAFKTNNSTFFRPNKALANN